MQKIKESERQIWNTIALTIFGCWLWDKKEYGHALLALHGTSLGMKVGEQLNLKWHHLIDEDNQIRYTLTYDDGKIKKRQLGSFFQNITLQCYKEMKIKDKNEYVYKNSKTDKVLTTSTLNRELGRLSETFINEVYENTGRYLTMKELKSNAFEIAWAIDMVNHYNCTKKVFIEVSRHMGHRTMEDTYALLGMEPNDAIELRFNLLSYTFGLDIVNVFKDKRKYGRLIDDTALLTISKIGMKERGLDKS